MNHTSLAIAVGMLAVMAAFIGAVGISSIQQQQNAAAQTDEEGGHQHNELYLQTETEE